jgi:hypothetical protein
MTNGRRPASIGLGLALLLFAGVSEAQTRSADDVLSFLITNQSVSTGDFVKDAEASEATRDTLVRALLVELANVPLTTSSGGFNYRFNSSLGTFERVTQGFGPFFVDRATTVGRGQASLSATFRYSRFNTLDQRNLRDGSLVTSSNKFGDETAAFDVETLKLDIQTSTVTVFGSYGVTDEIDVGVAIPIVSLRLSGERTNIYRGASFLQARGQADYVGIADIPVRVKLQFDRASGWDLATDLELRLPTGDRANLNGSGRYALRGGVIASATSGALESHVNAGLTVGGASTQLNGAAAIAATMQDRVTFSAEALVRRISRLGGIHEIIEPHSLLGGVDTLRLLPTGESTTTMAAVGGIRWNVARTWLLNSYVVIPITAAGLLGPPIPTVSLDYSFEP